MPSRAQRRAAWRRKRPSTRLRSLRHCQTKSWRCSDRSGAARPIRFCGCVELRASHGQHLTLGADFASLQPLLIPKLSKRDLDGGLIGIGGRLATPPLPHHRAYGSVPRRFDRVRLGRSNRFGEDRAARNSRCVASVGPPDVRTCARAQSVSQLRPLRQTSSASSLGFMRL